MGGNLIASSKERDTVKENTLQSSQVEVRKQEEMVGVRISYAQGSYPGRQTASSYGLDNKAKVATQYFSVIKNPEHTAGLRRGIKAKPCI